MSGSADSDSDFGPDGGRNGVFAGEEVYPHMPMTERDNFLMNASLQGHAWIPQHVSVSTALWQQGREELETVCLRHPLLFPGLEKGRTNFDDGVRDEDQHRKTDIWGCEWEYELDGLEGIVVGHPLADWAAFETWTPLTPPPFDDKAREALATRRHDGHITTCDTDHGFLFMRLYYLRGFENFMMDVAAEEPRLDALIEAVVGHWEQVLLPRVEAGVDVLNAADDLGTQTASMLGAAHFRRWLMPAYQRLFQPARRAGSHVFMHHDGYVMDIMDEIIETGVSIVNPQDLVNGIDNIAREIKGRACIRLDIDRQQVVPFGSPGDVRDLIKESVLKLGSPAGGLEMVAGLYPPTPVENVEALCSALEEFRTYWVGR